MKTLAVFLFASLGFVLIHEDNQLDLLRDKVAYLEHHQVGQDAKPINPAPASRAETHDEVVERARSESMRRRKEYCDSHPNLTVRIGCE
jgi:hypothetical protein